MHWLSQTLILVLSSKCWLFWGILCNFKICWQYTCIYILCNFRIHSYGSFITLFGWNTNPAKILANPFTSNLKTALKQINIARPWLFGITVFHCNHIYTVSSVGCDIKTENSSSPAWCFAGPIYQLKQFKHWLHAYLIN